LVPCALVLFVAYLALVSHFWGATDADALAGTPTAAGIMVIAEHCARRKNDPKVRHQVLVLIPAVSCGRRCRLPAYGFLPQRGTRIRDHFVA
jgi:hypothetical protein